MYTADKVVNYEFVDNRIIVMKWYFEKSIFQIMYSIIRNLCIEMVYCYRISVFKRKSTKEKQDFSKFYIASVYIKKYFNHASRSRFSPLLFLLIQTYKVHESSDEKILRSKIKI